MTTITIAGMLKRAKTCPQNTGICNQWTLKNLGSSGRDLLKKVMMRWPKHSGDGMYPIPSPDTAMTPHKAYHECSQMWDHNTEYGRLRWELLNWLIEQPELRKPLVVVVLSKHSRRYDVE